MAGVVGGVDPRGGAWSAPVAACGSGGGSNIGSDAGPAPGSPGPASGAARSRPGPATVAPSGPRTVPSGRSGDGPVTGAGPVRRWTVPERFFLVGRVIHRRNSRVRRRAARSDGQALETASAEMRQRNPPTSGPSSRGCRWSPDATWKRLSPRGMGSGKRGPPRETAPARTGFA